MFHYIEGIYKGMFHEYVILDVNGIGFQIEVPTNCAEKLPSLNEPLRLYTEMVVKEDGANIYGFLDKEALDIFHLIVGKVSGIGPKGALNILSTLTVKEFGYALQMDDVKTISKAPGIGAKTAKRLILELKDKIELESLQGETFIAQPAEEQDNELEEALLALGYTRYEISKIGFKIDKMNSFEQQIRQALTLLSKGK